ncbi:class I SAM-dependent methyltransferase [Shewanella sp. 202IG2-18]|uniref:methyltransferase domain-containing protein n=1 Tax=Parashewanella hymeniacidonis TaxID=2807618 RepID=UPI001961821A|nr:class I SAM-dependent methyltransferase [Parashewanella hymeniacidonis]MBM7071628.1 class I SAM-dependent methyltransferase [Parashewanella hymeniacidonis]
MKIFLIEKGWDVSCIDSSSRPLKIMSQRAKGFPGHFSFQQGDFSNVSMNGKYDFVFSVWSLPFGEKSDMLSIFQTIHDHLKPNGVFAFTMNGPKASFNEDGCRSFRSTNIIKRSLIISVIA